MPKKKQRVAAQTSLPAEVNRDSAASAETHMRSAIRLAIAGVRDGKGGPFGAVVVRKGKVVARGVNSVTSSLDPTAHAEVVAIRQACQKLKRFKLDDCELYTSCEPCPMCLSAIYWARIPTVYFAGTRKDAAEAGFDDDFLYDELKLPLEERKLPLRQLLREDAQKAFQSWIQKPDKVRY